MASKNQRAISSSRTRQGRSSSKPDDEPTNGSASDSRDSTRTRVIEAAIACILEEGFYRASSNEIARRADVTWGVIQYYFGSREALLLAVLEHAVTQLQSGMAKATIHGDSLEERIDSLADVVWSFYGDPEFLAYIQVMLNLSHDPNTEQQTREALRENQLHVSHQLPQLLTDALEPDLPSSHPNASALRAFVFAALRGMAIDQAHLKALPRDVPVDPAVHAAERWMLVQALARQIEAAVDEHERGAAPRKRRVRRS